MNRPIKFIAWDKRKKVMVSHDELYKLDCSNEFPFLPLLTNMYSNSIIPFDVEIMQFTGLRDRNGKEIYQESVILITGEQELDYGYTFHWDEKAIVRWDDEECGFYLDVINKREVILCEDAMLTVDRFPLRKWTDEEWWIEYEVICEHHHLLKGEVE